MFESTASTNLKDTFCRLEGERSNGHVPPDAHLIYELLLSGALLKGSLFAATATHKSNSIYNRLRAINPSSLTSLPILS